MKTLKYFCLALIVLASCTDHETSYSINPELSTYVDAFYADAKANNIDIPKNLIAELRSNQQTIEIHTTNDQNYIYVDANTFRAMNEENAQLVIYVGLAGVLLRKNVTSGGYGLTLDQIKAEIFN